MSARQAWIRVAVLVIGLWVTGAAPAAPAVGSLVRIPAGSFEMGDHHGFVDPQHGSDELPLHTVRLNAFDIGVYLTGGSQLLCDARQSSPSSPIGWDGRRFTVLDGKERHPVVCGGVLAQGELPGKDVRGHLFNAVFKAHRYAPDYAGLRGRDLTPRGVIELPAAQKGKTGLDRADASPNDRPPGAARGRGEKEQLFADSVVNGAQPSMLPHPQYNRVAATTSS